MVSLATLIHQRHAPNPGRAGRNGSWRIEKPDSDPYRGQEFELWHYNTRMLYWRESRRNNGVEILDLDLGNGSMSDQMGMNVAFRIIGAPNLYYSRAGGARIIDQETHLPVAQFI